MPSDLSGAIDILKCIRAVSLPILTEKFRLALLAEARHYSLRPACETVGSGANTVYQDMLLQDQLDMSGVFGELVYGFQKLFDQAPNVTNHFDGQVIFNDVIIQRYEPGSGGITPHRDRTDYRHIICLFVLKGHGRFYIADDRQKTNQVEILNLPGDVLLMPGPGFANLKHRPFHYLEDITEERWIFGLRHDASKLS